MNIFEKNFSLVLKQARKNLDISQERFAEVLGLPNQAAVSRCESGGIPSGEDLYRIALVLGITVEELLTGQGNPNLQTSSIRKEPVTGDTLDLESQLKEAAAVVPGRPLALKRAAVEHIANLANELTRRYAMPEPQEQPVHKVVNERGFPISSDPDGDAAKVQAGVSSLAQRPRPKSSPLPATGSPSGQKSAPKTGI